MTVKIMYILIVSLPNILWHYFDAAYSVIEVDNVYKLFYSISV